MAQGILFLGDFFYDYPDLQNDIREIGKWIRERELVTVLNLEGCIARDRSTPIKKRGPNLSCSDQAIDALKELQTVGVCLANNHMMDYGDQGLRNTLDALDEADILHTGAGRSLNEAVCPMRIPLGSYSVSILNFGWKEEETVYAGMSSCGCSPRENNVIFPALANVKNSGDIPVVFMHWGFEYNRLPMPFDIDLAHRMIDAGAELVLGSHPHNVQPKESYKARQIYYSLGNFYFASRRDRFNRRFHETISNLCDYGIGVIWDVEIEKMEETLYQYSKENGETHISASCEDLQLILEDNSGNDFFSDNYLKQASERKDNRNPILTLNEEYNRVALRRFNTIRRMKSIGRKLLRKC